MNHTTHIQATRNERPVCEHSPAWSQKKRLSFSGYSFSLVDALAISQDEHELYDIEPTPLHEIDLFGEPPLAFNGIEIDDPIFSGLDLATYIAETKVCSSKTQDSASLVSDDDMDQLDFDFDFLLEKDAVAEQDVHEKPMESSVRLAKMTTKEKGSKPKRKVSSPKRSKIFKPEVKQYVTLREMDVLHGRGAHGRSYPGNIRFHQEKDKRSQIYLQAPSVHEKMAIAQELVDTVHAYGGRFVEKDSTGWYVAHPRSARGKASQALRDTRLSTDERRIKRKSYGEPWL